MMFHGLYRLFEFVLIPASASSSSSFRTKGRCIAVVQLLLALLCFTITTSEAATVNVEHDHLEQNGGNQTHQQEYHHNDKPVLQQHPARKNPAFQFVRGGRPQAPASAATSADQLTNMFNKLKSQHQDVHPESDKLKGGMGIQWKRDMFFLVFGRQTYQEKFGVRRSPHPSTGAPWPLPKRYARNDKLIFRIDKDHFEIRTDVLECDIMDKAVHRYVNNIVLNSLEDLYDNLQHAEETTIKDPLEKYSTDLYTKAPVISTLDVYIKKPCKNLMYPSITSDESYHIIINSNETTLVANEVWGALRGLETFSQLVWKGTDQKLYVMETIVIDKPRFPHRGIMIDTARHYIFKEVIFDVMDAMEMNKMNVLHWHIVDDQSFPYESKIYPEMSKKGAYHPAYVYSHEDIEHIIEYGRLRGIRIIPEFDVPGHTYSWGLSRPGLLAHCSNPASPILGKVGPMDASKDDTYVFLKNIFQEILGVFKDEYLHIGGDEVPVDCWAANPIIMRDGRKKYKDWQQKKNTLFDNIKNKVETTLSKVKTSVQNAYHGNAAQGRPVQMSSFDEHQLWNYFQNRFMDDLNEIKKSRPAGLKYMMWQEAAMTTNIQKYANDTLAIIWFGAANLMRQAISKGYRVLFTSCWYLDNISPGPDWEKYYRCDPAFPGQGVDETKVMGGEACAWAEYITNENLMVLLWPRASAAAERLWSSRDTRDFQAAAPRLHEHRCRMLSRGLAVNHANGPDYCLRGGRVKGSRTRDDLGQIITITKKATPPALVVTTAFQSKQKAVETASPAVGHEDMFQEMVIIIQVFIILTLLTLMCRKNKDIKDRVFRTLTLGGGSRRVVVVFVCACGLFSVIYVRMWSQQLSDRSV